MDSMKSGPGLLSAVTAMGSAGGIFYLYNEIKALKTEQDQAKAETEKLLTKKLMVYEEKINTLGREVESLRRKLRKEKKETKRVVSDDEEEEEAESPLPIFKKSASATEEEEMSLAASRFKKK